MRAGVSGETGHYQQHFFAAEAALVGRLQHPNVVQIYDAVDDPLGPYLVMEYVDGPTLRRWCRPDSLLPLDQIVEVGFKCAMALGYVARQGLIHRDIKPANLLAVVRDGQVADVKVTQLDIEGTYQFRNPPFDPNAKVERKANYRMFSVYFDSENGPYFIRMTGPMKTMEQAKKGFDEWLKNFK